MSEAPRTPGRRTINYATVDAVLADVAVLRRGHGRVGRWTLPQACLHLATTINGSLTPPPDGAGQTAEQAAKWAGFSGMVLGAAGFPEGLPLSNVPPESAGDAEVDALATAFAALTAYPHDRVIVGSMGPVPIEGVRQLHLSHAAHHLSFLTPTTVRRTLDYRSLADVAADVRHLRKAYVRSASWTLPQVCWHLQTVMTKTAGRPMAEPTADMAARRPVLDAVLSGGPLPAGLPSPPEVDPPADAGDAAIDGFLSFLAERAGQPFTPVMHRLFGPLTAAEAEALTLRHCAHHLSHLIPTGAEH